VLRKCATKARKREGEILHVFVIFVTSWLP
jgi:hypothetical protein